MGINVQSAPSTRYEWLNIISPEIPENLRTTTEYWNIMRDAKEINKIIFSIWAGLFKWDKDKKTANQVVETLVYSLSKWLSWVDENSALKELQQRMEGNLKYLQEVSKKWVDSVYYAYLNTTGFEIPTKPKTEQAKPVMSPAQEMQPPANTAMKWGEWNRINDGVNWIKSGSSTARQIADSYS